jgi:selenocysteine-specific elongation factor
VIVGTAGHIDHGKTALVRRLTGIDTDRLPEEKKRGISIDLGFAHWPRPDGRIISFVDVPGHEGLVHNMVAGATGIDCVLLVVAADDGVMPQTREHLAIVDLLGLERGLVALNKCDRVDASQIAASVAEVRAALLGTGLAHCDILAVSATTGEGIDGLATRLDGLPGSETMRRVSGRFRLAVDRSFVRIGLGTIVTGTIVSGEVHPGDRLLISPVGLEARVRSIHVGNRPADVAQPGKRCALVLSGSGISPQTVGRGDFILDPTLHAPTNRIDAKLHTIAAETKPIGDWYPVRIHHAANAVSGHVVVLRDAPIAPGESDFVQLVLDRPVAAAIGDRFILRDTSSRRTIGGGVFLDLRAPERRRRSKERRAELGALLHPDAEGALAHLLETRAFVNLDYYFRDRAALKEAPAAAGTNLGLETFVVGSGRVGTMPQTWRHLRREICALLDNYHAAEPDRPGLSAEQLRHRLSHRVAPDLFLAMLRRSAELGDVVIDRSWVRRPHHQALISTDDDGLWTEIHPFIAETPYRPPRVRDISRSTGLDETLVRRALHKAMARGDVEEIGRDRFFTRAAVDAMLQIAVDVASASAKAELSTAAFRDRLDNGRKVAVQILEFFDRIGATKRRNDLRYLNTAGIGWWSRKRDGASTADSMPCGGGSSPVGRPDFKSG